MVANMMNNIAEMTLYEAAGLLGVAFYLGSYAALQMRMIGAEGYSYPLFNFMAASLVLISLFESFNMPSLIIQISWITISLYGMITLLMRSRSDEPKVTEDFRPVLTRDPGNMLHR